MKILQLFLVLVCAIGMGILMSFMEPVALQQTQTSILEPRLTVQKLYHQQLQALQDMGRNKQGISTTINGLNIHLQLDMRHT